MDATKGFLQVYTGKGKGKTTAAFGLAIRAAGAGFRVFIVQFVKGSEYSEVKAVQRFSDLIALKQYGAGFLLNRKPNNRDIQSAQEGLKEARRILISGDYQLVILDEANIAVHYHLFSIDDLLDTIRQRQENVEIVITGRYAHQKLLDEADLVTDMQEVKHYFSKGVAARKGIEK